MLQTIYPQGPPSPTLRFQPPLPFNRLARFNDLNIRPKRPNIFASPTTALLLPAHRWRQSPYPRPHSGTIPAFVGSEVAPAHAQLAAASLDQLQARVLLPGPAVS